LATAHDLKAVLVGAVIVFLGSMFASGGYYWTVLNNEPAGPLPTFGGVIFYLGLSIMVIGAVLAVLCVGVNLAARLSRQGRTEADHG
jgi:hypothetical protein